MRRTDREGRAKKPVRLDLDPDLHHRLRLKSAEANQPMSTYVFELINQDLQATEGEAMRTSIKPSWMTQDEYREFVKINPPECCNHCHCDDCELLTIDHIVPRVTGGTDDFSNLQWLCFACNSAKRDRPDKHWSRKFPFDATPDLTKCWGSQREKCWDLILSYFDYFSRPISAISQIIYILAWIVGAGKSIAPVIAACAINHVLRLRWGTACPRIDRILILTPAQAIRSGIDRDLKKLLGIIFPGTPFRIHVITNGSILDTPSYIEGYDIHISCVQMFFSEHGKPRDNLAKILAKFGLICIDEPHIAPEQVKHIVSYALQSIVLGPTATPIYSNGSLMRHMVLLSHYGYEDAHKNDGSMKELNNDCFTEIIPESLDVHQAGEKSRVPRIDHEDHVKQFRPELYVAESVLQRMVETDKIIETPSLWEEEESTHRTGKKIGHTFYAHAMIVVGSRKAAEELTRQINHMVDSRPDLYPKAKGYGAVFAVGNNDDDFKDTKNNLDKNHPWMLASVDPKHRLKPKSVRILVVCDMGREGLNNPTNCILGIAREDVNLRDLIQWIGRILRACSLAGIYPPRVLDRCSIISHSVFKIRVTFVRAVEFILHSEPYFDGLLTLENIMENGMPTEGTSLTPDAPLSREEKMRVIRGVGEGLIDGGPDSVDIPGIIEAVGRNSPAKRENVSKLIDDLLDDPGKVRKQLSFDAELREIPRVLDEIIPIAPSNDVLLRFVKREHPLLLELATKAIGGEYREFLVALYSKYRSNFCLEHPVNGPDTLQTIRTSIAAQVNKELGLAQNDSDAFPLVGQAMRIIFGVNGKKEKLVNGGQYDTAICHSILNRPKVRSSIVSVVSRKLVESGRCKSTAVALRIESHDREES